MISLRAGVRERGQGGEPQPRLYDLLDRAEHDAIAALETMLLIAAAGEGRVYDGVGDNNDLVATYECAYAL